MEIGEGGNLMGKGLQRGKGGSAREEAEGGLSSRSRPPLRKRGGKSAIFVKT